MKQPFFHWRSLKTRLTLLMLALFLAGTWLPVLYVNRLLHVDMERMLGEQQFSTVSLVAADINDALVERLNALGNVAGRAGLAMQGGAAAMERFLEDRPVLGGLFNGGFIALDLEGNVMVDVPRSAGREGMNFMDRDYVAGAIREETPTVGRPVLAKKLRLPSFGMAVPIRDPQGRVIGALAGLINLAEPNFLSRIMEGTYGETGGYLVVAKQQRQVVTATDKRRIMEVLPAPGVIPLIDRYIDGWEGSSVLVNPQGVEVMASAKGVPVAGWYAGVSLPTAEAFAPVHAMKRRFLQAMLVFTLLAGGLTWWLVHRQLAPLFVTVKALADSAQADRPTQPLAIARRDELGELIGGFNRLLETLAQREAALREGELRYRTLADSGQALIWTSGLDKGCDYFNQTWLTFTGRTLSQEMGNGWVEGVHPDDLVRCVETYTTAFDRRKRFSMDYRMRRHDGEYRWMQDDGSPRYDSKGVFLGYIGHCLDITERKRAEEERAALAAVIQRKNEELENLVYVTSHDLRSPLLNIQGFGHRLKEAAEALQRAAAMPEWSEEMRRDVSEIATERVPRALGFIHSSVEKMSRLIEGLLRLSRLGRAGMLTEALDLNRMMESIRAAMAYQIQAAGVDIEAESLPSCVGDATLINQLFTNLLDNAVKYRDPARPLQLRITGRQEGGRAVYTVADNGVGIPAAHLERIWDLFHRVDPAGPVAGEGLGLSLVRRIVDRHGGEIRVESTPGEGTRFVVSLPIGGALPGAASHGQIPREVDRGGA